MHRYRYSARTEWLSVSRARTWLLVEGKERGGEAEKESHARPGGEALWPGANDWSGYFDNSRPGLLIKATVR